MFLVGAGLLQVPAGFLALRHGARAVSIAGVALLAVTGAASAAAPSFDALLLLRLGSGFGAALFFSPAIGLVASLYPAGRRGLPVGTFSSAFSAGAALGIVGSSVLVPMIGWRGALLVGGVALGVLAVAALAAIPRGAGRPLAREAIWRIYEKKYDVTGERPEDEGWTGAEIKECCRKAGRLRLPLVRAAQYTVPISKSAAEQIKSLQEAQKRARNTQ